MNEANKGVALVTGASRGIGRVIAIQLAKDGYNLAFCYKHASTAAEEVKSKIEQLGSRVFLQTCDVGNFDSVQSFIKDAEVSLGPITLVVNNAGVIDDNPLFKMDLESWSSVINSNLDSVFNVCRCTMFGFLKRKKGCIINISSVAGVYGNAFQVNYSASKAGIIGFSKALAKEVGQYGIRVNVVAPGFIATDMTEGLNSKIMEQAISNIPLRRIGEVQEVADLVSFLASNKASYITGQTIQVDGGIIL